MPKTLANPTLLFFVLALAHPVSLGATASDVNADAEVTLEDLNARPDPRRPDPNAALALTQKERTLIDRPDRKRPDRGFSFAVFDRPLTIGGRFTLNGSHLENRLLKFDFFDRDRTTGQIEDERDGKPEEDDLSRFSASLQLDAFYPISENVAIFLGGTIRYRSVVSAEVAEEIDVLEIDRGETWLYLGNLFSTPIGLQVGAQRFFDEREWWWDQNLDSVRLRFDLSRVHAELSVAKAIAPDTSEERFIEPREEDVLRVLGQLSWEWTEKNRIGLFVAHQADRSSAPSVDSNGDGFPDSCVRDFDGDGAPDPEHFRFGLEFNERGCVDPFREDESDANLTWVGGSAAGRAKFPPLGSFHYWLDFAYVKGREAFFDFTGASFQRRLRAIIEHDVSGWGVNVGGTWATQLPGRPRLTFVYAYGSGEPGSTEESDGSFRQTGLQDNNSKFQGVDAFKYYGELLDPELSNLQILTAALGFPLFRKSSVELVYHRYRQVEPTRFLRDVDFKRRPDGVHREIGDEFDVVLGIEEWERVEIEVIGSMFRAGKAFQPRDGRISYLGVVQFRLNF